MSLFDAPQNQPGYSFDGNAHSLAILTDVESAPVCEASSLNSKLDVENKPDIFVSQNFSLNKNLEFQQGLWSGHVKLNPGRVPLADLPVELSWHNGEGESFQLDFSHIKTKNNLLILSESSLFFNPQARVGLNYLGCTNDGRHCLSWRWPYEFELDRLVWEACDRIMVGGNELFDACDFSGYEVDGDQIALQERLPELLKTDTGRMRGYLPIDELFAFKPDPNKLPDPVGLALANSIREFLVKGQGLEINSLLPELGLRFAFSGDVDFSGELIDSIWRASAKMQNFNLTAEGFSPYQVGEGDLAGGLVCETGPLPLVEDLSVTPGERTKILQGVELAPGLTVKAYADGKGLEASLNVVLNTTLNTPWGLVQLSGDLLLYGQGDLTDGAIHWIDFNYELENATLTLLNSQTHAPVLRVKGLALQHSQEEQFINSPTDVAYRKSISLSADTVQALWIDFDHFNLAIDWNSQEAKDLSNSTKEVLITNLEFNAKPSLSDHTFRLGMESALRLFWDPKAQQIFLPQGRLNATFPLPPPPYPKPWQKWQLPEVLAFDLEGQEVLLDLAKGSIASPYGMSVTGSGAGLKNQKGQEVPLGDFFVGLKEFSNTRLDTSLCIKDFNLEVLEPVFSSLLNFYEIDLGTLHPNLCLESENPEVARVGIVETSEQVKQLILQFLSNKIKEVLE